MCATGKTVARLMMMMMMMAFGLLAVCACLFACSFVARGVYSLLAAIEFRNPDNNTF